MLAKSNPYTRYLLPHFCFHRWMYMIPPCLPHRLSRPATRNHKTIPKAARLRRSKCYLLHGYRQYIVRLRGCLLDGLLPVCLWLELEHFPRFSEFTSWPAASLTCFDCRTQIFLKEKRFQKIRSCYTTAIT